MQTIYDQHHSPLQGQNNPGGITHAHNARVNNAYNYTIIYYTRRPYVETVSGMLLQLLM